MLDPPPTEVSGRPRDSAAPRSVRHVIAVGGGRGGTGASTIAVNLAVYLAQLGRRVVLVDADPAGAELHTTLDVPHSLYVRQDDESFAVELEVQTTSIPGLLIMPQLYVQGSTVPLRPGRKALWAKKLRQLDADHVILDLGAGTAPATLDLFLSADLGICPVTPEPPSVEATYRFARALYLRRLRRLLIKDRFKMRLVERAQGELPALPAPIDLLRAVARYDPVLGEAAAHELTQVRPRLVVNKIRLRTDSDLSAALCEMARRFLGVEFDPVGQIEHDDSVWLSVVKKRPLLIDSPTSKSARHLERIARRVLALVSTPDIGTPASAPSLVVPELSLYDVLGTHRGASDEELRRAYKRQRSNFEPQGLAITSLLTEAQRVREAAAIEEAHDTLLDPLRRRSYDLSTFPPDQDQAEHSVVSVDRAREAERELLREELAREITADTEFTGALLGRVRESLGVDLAEIAQRTKISVSYLRAIEAEDVGSLPAQVYTRGFLQQLARCLNLDSAQVTRTYLRRIRGLSQAGGGARPS